MNNALEKSMKTLLLSSKFIQIMDDKQKTNLDTQIDRLTDKLRKSIKLLEMMREIKKNI